MNKQVVLVQFNKRSTVNLLSKDLDVIIGMKGYSLEKVASAFSMLSGKDLGLKDLELLFLIIELAEALSPGLVMPRLEPFGTPTPRHPGWPYQNTVMCGQPADSVMQAISRAARQ